MNKAVPWLVGVGVCGVTLAVIVAINARGSEPAVIAPGFTAHDFGLGVDAAPPIDARRSTADIWKALHLPDTGIDASKVLWRTRAEVDGMLGRGEDADRGMIRYPRGTGVAVVMFDHGRSVGVIAHVPLTSRAKDFGQLDHEEEDALFLWFGYGDDAAMANGRAVVLGNEVDGADFAAYEKSFADARQAEIDKAAAIAAEKFERETIAASEKAKRDEELRLLSMTPAELRQIYLDKLNSTSDGRFKLSIGGDGTAVIVTPREFCDDTILGIYNTDLGVKFRTFGFTWLVCADQASRQRL